MTATVRTIDPNDDAAYRAWYTAYRAAWTADRPAAILPNEAEMRHLAAHPGPDIRRILAAALDAGGTTVGGYALALTRQDNLNLAFPELGVPPEHRRHGIGTLLLDHCAHTAAADGRTIFEAEVFSPDGGPASAGLAFARRHGFTTELTEHHYTLPLPVDEARLDAVDTEAAPRQQGYTFDGWTGSCPDELVDAYARLCTAMDLDLPSGGLAGTPTEYDAERIRAREKHQAALGRHLLVAVARAPGGELAGYSMLIVSAAKDEVIQSDTLVLRTHRGHALGYGMKTFNLRRLQRDFPGHGAVHTWSAETNAPMIAVNLRLGFTVAEEAHQMQRDVSRPPAR